MKEEKIKRKKEKNGYNDSGKIASHIYAITSKGLVNLELP